MKTVNINGTQITVAGDDEMGEAEIKRYLYKAREESPGEDVTWLYIVVLDDGQVSLDWNCRPPKFDRIRRITGYLVGTIDRWNNAKRSEERERVKHSIK